MSRPSPFSSASFSSASELIQRSQNKSHPEPGQWANSKWNKCPHPCISLPSQLCPTFPSWSPTTTPQFQWRVTIDKIMSPLSQQQKDWDVGQSQEGREECRLGAFGSLTAQCLGFEWNFFWDLTCNDNFSAFPYPKDSCSSIGLNPVIQTSTAIVCVSAAGGRQPEV